jgi:HSP20 family protein
MTTMLRWSPFPELDTIERRMRKVSEGIGFTPLPAADIFETEDEYVVELEVPGYEEAELGIDVFDHTLSVRGERTETTEEEERSFHLHERLEREFERRFVLPAEADTEHVEATFAKGVLEIHTPKLAAAKPHTVEITKA